MADSSGIDLEATRNWVSGVLTDPNGTAQAYSAQHPPVRRTFLHITLPVYVAAAILGFVLSWLFGRPYLLGAEAASPVWFVLSVAWSLLFAFIVAFVFDFFAGVFGGQRNFAAAFAALSLAAVPGALGSGLGPIPWLGWLISLAAGVYSLVLAYRFVPVFMAVPEAKRVLHFVVSVIVVLVVSMIVSVLVTLLFLPSAMQSATAPVETSSDSGLLGGFERQADFAEQAARDTYDPPDDGELTEAQVEAYVRTLQRTAELRERLGGKFENMDEDSPSLTDIFSGVGDAVRMGTAEMEVVKSGGGNWAEHQWVRNQIETARVQRDGSAAIEHNYELFLEYEDDIEALD